MHETNAATTRTFDVCLTPRVVVDEPQRLATVRAAGVAGVCLAGYFYGHEPYPAELLTAARRTLESHGLGVFLVNLPLGHPGDSLGARDGDFPLTPPPHWSLGIAADGKAFAGTSLAPPATEENVAALKAQRRLGFTRFFVDDDFRLARGPGEIGGSYSNHQRDAFLKAHGLADGAWDELLAAVRERRLTPVLRHWVDFQCDQLSASFQAMDRAAGGGLGNMVMYLGAEKAGLRLRDYRHAPLRVGELMFDDTSFGSVKGKTDELFSVLFHRRFVAPERAYSETTAYPADRLSAWSLAAKLAISTVADVRHTLFMSGLTPFPEAHWATLAPAMSAQKALHAKVAGHKIHGPLRHFWGEANRYVGRDQPFSLFLALGIPFAVDDAPARDGWTFLADADARAASEGRLRSPGTRFVVRAGDAAAGEHESCDESWPALLALKRRLIPQLGDVPYIDGDEPVVLAWYPSARSVLLWNVAERPRTFVLRRGGKTHEVAVAPLAAAIAPDLG